MLGRRGQVAIFVIVALLAVAGVAIYYLVDKPVSKTISPQLRPAYDAYLSCVKGLVEEGLRLLGDSGGYIESPPFVPGSLYAPSSSQLDFLGQGIPYWFYVSQNNLIREQVPTIDQMEKSLSDYVSSNIGGCNFDELARAGFDVFVGDEKSASSELLEGELRLKLFNPLTIIKGERRLSIENHEISVPTKIRKLYEEALKIYDYEKKSSFLEKYGLDAMRLNAPVTGAELSCSPLVFVDSKIQENISRALESNIASIKLSGNYYSVRSKDREYFVADPGFDTSTEVSFLYDRNWPTKIEIEGDRVVKPVGLQKGLGLLGFCYVPYHLVYDIFFPVLVQLREGDELFQFPVVAVISKNQAREPVFSDSSLESGVDACEYKMNDLEVRSYDINLNPVPARISYRCLQDTCELGSTEDVGGIAVLETKAPSCVGGSLVASADGYADSKIDFSSNEEDSADIILRKKYKLSLGLDVNSAVVSFDSPDYSSTVLYPEQDSIELVEGNYNVSVLVYDRSGLKFPASKKRECVSVPEKGLSGIFGAKREKCYTIDVPETEIGFALVGGGKTSEYVTEEMLSNSEKINIDVLVFDIPESLRDLQKNYALVEDARVYLDYE